MLSLHRVHGHGVQAGQRRMSYCSRVTAEAGRGRGGAVTGMLSGVSAQVLTAHPGPARLRQLVTASGRRAGTLFGHELPGDVPCGGAECRHPFNLSSKCRTHTLENLWDGATPN